MAAADRAQPTFHPRGCSWLWTKDAPCQPRPARSAPPASGPVMLTGILVARAHDRTSPARRPCCCQSRTRPQHRSNRGVAPCGCGGASGGCRSTSSGRWLGGTARRWPGRRYRQRKTAHHEHAAVAQHGGGERDPVEVHAPGRGPAVGRRVVQLGAGGVPAAAGGEHAPISQTNRGVKPARLVQRPARHHVPVSGSYSSVGRIAATDHQDAAVTEPRRRQVCARPTCSPSPSSFPLRVLTTDRCSVTGPAPARRELEPEPEANAGAQA
jgi:hypothetical protein